MQGLAASYRGAKKTADVHSQDVREIFTCGFGVDALLAVLQQRADGWAQANKAPLLVAAPDPSDGSTDRLAEAFDTLLDVTPPPYRPTGFEFL